MKKQLVIIGIMVLSVCIGLSGCNEQIKKAQNKPPTLIIGSNFTGGYSPLSIHFYCTANDSDGSIVSYLWDFGDGTTSTEQNPNHTFLEKGKIYQTVLTVTDDKGANSNSSVNITVLLNKPPTAVAHANITTGEAPLTVSFTGTGNDYDGNITSYHWNFGDGQSSSEQNPTHVFQNIGTFNVKLTVTDNEGDLGTSALSIVAKFAEPEIIAHNAYYDILDSMTVVGIIKNVATIPIQFMQIKITFYDSANNIIKTNMRTVWSDYDHKYLNLYTYVEPLTIYPGERGIFNDFIQNIPYYDHYDIKILDYEKTTGTTDTSDLVIDNINKEIDRTGFPWSYILSCDIKNIESSVCHDVRVYGIFYNSQGKLLTVESSGMLTLYSGEKETFTIRISGSYHSDAFNVEEISNYELFIS
jgi:PKD repeat protein